MIEDFVALLAGVTLVATGVALIATCIAIAAARSSRRALKEIKQMRTELASGEATHVDGRDERPAPARRLADRSTRGARVRRHAS